MTSQDIINKVNEYKGMVSSLEVERDSKISQRSMYSEGTMEYDNLSNDINELEGKITNTKMVIGL